MSAISTTRRPDFLNEIRKDPKMNLPLSQKPCNLGQITALSSSKSTLKNITETIGRTLDALIPHSKIKSLLYCGMAYSGYQAYQHGMKCATFAVARNFIIEKPSILTKILWSDRAWADYLPFTGAFKAESFFDLLSVKESVLPKFIQVFLNTASNVNGMKEIMNDADLEAAIAEYAKRLTPTQKTAFDRALSWADSGSQDLIAAECNEFEGYANTAATAGAVLLSIFIIKNTPGAITASYIGAKKLLNSAYKKCTG